MSQTTATVAVAPPLPFSPSPRTESSDASGCIAPPLRVHCRLFLLSFFLSFFLSFQSSNKRREAGQSVHHHSSPLMKFTMYQRCPLIKGPPPMMATTIGVVLLEYCYCYVPRLGSSFCVCVCSIASAAAAAAAVAPNYGVSCVVVVEKNMVCEILCPILNRLLPDAVQKSLFAGQWKVHRCWKLLPLLFAFLPILCTLTSFSFYSNKNAIFP